MASEKVYIVYFDAGDYVPGDRNEKYYINKNGEYGNGESKSNVIFDSPEDAKSGVNQFLKERESKGLHLIPRDEYGNPIMKGKWIIKGIVNPEAIKKMADELEFEIQERKKKLTKSKSVRKPIKKVIKKKVVKKRK